MVEYTKEQLKNYVGEALAEGYDFDESMPPVKLDEESESLVDSFYNMCDSGMNKYEAFVKTFF